MVGSIDPPIGDTSAYTPNSFVVPICPFPCDRPFYLRNKGNPKAQSISFGLTTWKTILFAHDKKSVPFAPSPMQRETKT
jgi:hypothetical protein